MKRLFSTITALAMAVSLCMSALPVYAEGEPTETPVCTCTEKCTEDAVNDGCPVCAEDLTQCVGTAAEPEEKEEEPEAPQAPVCICTEKCTEGAANDACPVCAEDLTRCVGTAAEPEEKEPEASQAPVCTCTEKCAEGAVNDACPVCAEDLTRCAGTAEEPEEKEPETPQAPVCTCTEKCTEGVVNDACPVCAEDLTRCAGTAEEPEENPEKPQAPTASTTLTLNYGIAPASVTEITEAGGELAAGTYTLDRDIVLQSPLVIPANAEVTIDLNGHTLTAAGEVINVKTGKASSDVSTKTYGKLTVTGDGALTSTGSGSVITVNAYEGTATGGATDKGSLTMTGNITVTGNGDGSVIYAQYSDLTLTGNIVVSGGKGTEYAGLYYGGGIFCDGTSTTATVNLNGVTVRDNHLPAGVNSHGAGFAGLNCTVRIENCIFEDNSVEMGGGGGIALLYPSSASSLTNCVIRNNSAVQGGGIEITGKTMTDTVTLQNCTILDNTASFNGGGLVLQTATCVVDGGIITGNAAAGTWGDGNLMSGTGGGIYTQYSPLSLKNGAVVAGNTAKNGGADVCFFYMQDASGTLTLPDPKSFGIDGLDKWYDDAPGNRFNEGSQGRESVTGVTETTYLIAGKVNTVTFDSNGGSFVAPMSVVYGKQITAPAAPTLEKYKFTGWTLDGKAFDFTTLVTKNITLVANWERDYETYPVYTLTFETNGGSTIEPWTELDKGKTVSLPHGQEAPTKKGYVFAGWYDNEKLSGKPITEVVMDGSKTVYAKWEEVKEGGITLMFDTRGGTPATEPIFIPYSALGLDEDFVNLSDDEQEEIQDSAIYKFYEYMEDFPVAEPSLEGYDFLYWYINYFDLTKTSFTAVPELAAYYEERGSIADIENSRKEVEEKIEAIQKQLEGDLSEEERAALEKKRLALLLDNIRAPLFGFAEMFGYENFLNPSYFDYEEVEAVLGLDHFSLLPDYFLYTIPVYGIDAARTLSKDVLKKYLSQPQVYYLTAEYKKTDAEYGPAFPDNTIPDPTEEEVEKLLENAIQTTCASCSKEVLSGLLGEAGADYTITHASTSAVATVTVTNTQLYVNNFDTETGLTGHSFDYGDPQNLEISLLYVDGEGWKLPASTTSPAMTLYVTDSQSAITITPADITIYMGGEEGYQGAVEDGQGTIHASGSLPTPGFTVTLPESLKGVPVTDLVLQYEKDESTTLEWELQPYGGSSGSVYRIEPKNGSKTPVRMVFTNAAGKTITEDKFDVHKNLNQTLTMKVYGEAIEANEAYFLYNGTKYPVEVGKDATIMVRGTTASVQYGEVKEGPADIKAGTPGATASAGTVFTINNSAVQVGDDAQVSLLFDGIIDSNASADGKNYTRLLEEKVGQALAGTPVTEGMERTCESRYLDLVDENNGNTWVTAQDGHGNAGIVTVYWPLPEGTNKNTEFTVLHFTGLHRSMTPQEITGTLTAADYTPEVIEPLRVTDTHVVFETTGFSPFVLAWETPKTSAPPEDGEDKEDAAPSVTPAPDQNKGQDSTDAPAEQTKLDTVQPTAVIPQTGDESQPLVRLVLAAGSLSLLALLLAAKRRREEK